MVTITLANRDGAAYRVDRRKPLLATLEAAGVSLPYGCRYGGCISCAAKLLDGEVDQRAGVALNGRQLANGYVLLCVAFADPLQPHELKPGIATLPRDPS
jgi:ferredoxin